MNYKEMADYWLSVYGLDKKFKTEIKNMDDQELKEAFGQDLEFGTGGLRGKLGAGTNRMNIYVVRKATLGFGNYLIKNVKKALKRGVVISFDNRFMSKEFSLEAAHVLTSLGFERVFCYNSLRPTPQLSWTVRHLKAAGGIMITASHNPKEYNGYKAYNEFGAQLNLKESEDVLNEVNAVESMFNIKVSENWKNVHFLYDEYDEEYLNDISTIRLNPNCKKDFKVVYTPLHGTGSVYIPRFLKELGYDVTPVIQQMENDPEFGAVSSSNPENPEAFDKAKNLATRIGAKIMLATDPDADRLGIGILHNGSWRLLTGNELAAIIFNYICINKAQNDIKWVQKAKKYLFSTIVSSQLTTRIAKKYNINTVLTLTGFKFIGEKCKEIEGKGEFVYGYEESYGCLIKDTVRDKDSVQASMMALEAASYYYEKGLDLVDVLEEIYKEFGCFKSSQANIQMEGLAGQSKIQQIMNYFKNEEISIEGYNIVRVEDYSKGIAKNVLQSKEEKLTLPKSNVIKFIMDDDSWFVLRPSGTEPKIKIYAEAVGATSDETTVQCETLKSKVLDIVNKI